MPSTEDYRTLWSDSVVYVVRFTEEQLLAAMGFKPPTADAGPDQTVDEGVTITLDGSNSTDPDDGIASYLWEQASGTSVVLSDPTAVQPTFTAPNVGLDRESLSFQLTVTDNGGLQSEDTCIVDVLDNIPPGGGSLGGVGGDGGCFIATAAYGSPMESHVETPRDFRDSYLLSCKTGRRIVKIYYRYSASVGDFIAKHEILRFAVPMGFCP